MQKIILASTSPRRKQLLEQLIGKNFTIQPSSYEEDNYLKKSPKDLVLFHSKKKARNIKEPNSIIIAADTIITYKNEVFGKPKNIQEAKIMLQNFKNKTIYSITGITILNNKTGKIYSTTEKTAIEFDNISESDITNYLNTKEWQGKAGAFSIQNKGAFLIKKINGCYFNIMGLPLNKITKLLKKEDISIWDYNKLK